MKFREAYLTGQTEFETIFDLTDEWNFSDETCTLREYLGLTAEEEDVWISQSDEALEDLLNEEKKKRLLFVDIDGTLLTTAKELTPLNARMMDKALKQGQGIILTTGRAPASTILQSKRLHLDKKGCYMICCNGAQVIDSASGKILFSQGLDLEIIRRCFKEAEMFGVYIQTYDQDLIIAQEDSPYLHEYSRILEMEYEVVPDAAAYMPSDYRPLKLLCLDKDHSKLDRFRDHLYTIYDGVLDISFSQETYLEIVSKGISKGNALIKMAEMLHVPLAHCIAAGDSENDISMIRTAGTGVAMANAEPAVKEAADYVTQADNNNSGIAEVIEAFVLQD